ncbi:MAG TPA: class I SAM-dependent methyltransferase [Candidatus Baltobacteraceae bacterium]|jgi:SAM-dependent methyltransferase|nr:class I SAM-dependent methyltransferase [Candidatus Baltobacteraceae bacterium]
MTTFDSLAGFYDAGRTGYSNELYGMLATFGLSSRHHVLDIACGTGLASGPLIENAVRVTGVDVSVPMLAKARERYPSATWVEGSAEALPFQPRTFDAAIGAQAFHHVDRTKAIAEILRVVKPGGIVGIWWKVLMDQDPVAQLRTRVAQEMGVDVPPSGLKGGFKEFYGSALQEPTLRVIPWHLSMPLDDYLSYERSRKNVRDAFGARSDRYFDELGKRLGEMVGEGPKRLALSYVQYLYLARTPPAK